MLLKLVFILSIFVLSIFRCRGQRNVFHVPISSEEGTAANLRCTMYHSSRPYFIIPGDHYFVIAWRKDGQLITNGASFVKDFQRRDDELSYVSEGSSDKLVTITSNIFFHNVKVTDAGLYQCGLYETDPRNGTAITARIGHMAVHYFPPAPVCQPRNPRYTIGQRRQLKVTCTSEIGSPPVRLTWSKTSGEKDSEYGGYKTDEVTQFAVQRQGDNTITSHLIIDSTTTILTKNSVYTCKVASDRYAMNRTCSVNVGVVWPFQVSIYPEEVIAHVGGTAEFKCRVQNVLEGGADDKQIQWSIEPNELNSSRITTSGETLYISDIEDFDNGTSVSCYALFEGRWFMATAVLYVITYENSETPEKARGQTSSASAWMYSFFVAGTLLIITLVVSAGVYRRYHSRKQTHNQDQNIDVSNLNLRPIENGNPLQQQHEYRELHLEQGTLPSTYTDLKPSGSDRTGAGNVESSDLEYTYVDKLNSRQTTSTSGNSEEVYDYAETEINPAGPGNHGDQPRYINRPLKYPLS